MTRVYTILAIAGWIWAIVFFAWLLVRLRWEAKRQGRQDAKSAKEETAN